MKRMGQAKKKLIMNACSTGNEHDLGFMSLARIVAGSVQDRPGTCF